MKKAVLIMLLLSILFSGCVREIISDNDFQPATTTGTIIETERQVAEYNVIDISDGISELTATYINVDIPEEARISDYFVYDEYIFYAYDYWSYINVTDVSDSAELYYPQLCLYNIDTNENIVIDSIPSISAYFDDLYFDGTNFVWSQNQYVGMDVNVEMYTKSVDKDDTKLLSINGIPISIMYANGYVFIRIADDKDQQSVYRYDLHTFDYIEIIQNISQKKYSECIDAVGGVIYYTETTDKAVKVEGYNFEGNKVYEHSVDILVNSFQIYGNSHFVVWKDNQNMLCAYDVKTKEFLKLGKAEEFVVANDYVISLQSGSLVSYKSGDAVQKNISLQENVSKFNNVNHKIRNWIIY